MKPEILFTFRNEPDNQGFVFRDDGGLAIRTMFIRKSGESKVCTISITAEELETLARYVNGYIGRAELGLQPKESQ